MLPLQCPGCNSKLIPGTSGKLHLHKCKAYIALKNQPRLPRTQETQPSRSEAPELGFGESSSGGEAGSSRKRPRDLREGIQPKAAVTLKVGLPKSKRKKSRRERRDGSDTDTAALPNTPEPEAQFVTRKGRRVRQPVKYRDYIHSVANMSDLNSTPPPPIVGQDDIGSEIVDTSGESSTSEDCSTDSSLPAPDFAPTIPVYDPSNERFTTPPNHLGVYREYPHRPSFIPDSRFQLEHIALAPNMHEPDWSEIGPPPPLFESVLEPTGRGDPLQAQEPADFGPFKNWSTWAFVSTYEKGSASKSVAHLNALREVIRDKRFRVEDLDFNAQTLWKQLDDVQINTPTGWVKTSVYVDLPRDSKLSKKKKKQSRAAGLNTTVTEAAAPQYEVEDILYRPILDIMKEVVEENSDSFHFTPFRCYRKQEGHLEPERIFEEFYDSEEFVQEYENIRAQNANAIDHNGNPVEVAIYGIMEYTDAFIVSQFGSNSSLWPGYLTTLNVSKHKWGKVTSAVLKHHIYLRKLPDELQEEYRRWFGEGANSSTITHLRRELVQLIWGLLLEDKDFRDAYDNGVLIFCPGDQVWRLFFPRFFIYSCDYPEKVILCSIKYLSKYPCPLCLVPKADFHLMGTREDLALRREHPRKDSEDRHERVAEARKLLFRGHTMASKKIKSLMDVDSSTPNSNAWSNFLFPRRVNYFGMFAPDVLHELEAGVFKDIFTHLLRILAQVGGDSILELNKRYSRMPPFGRGVIRRFTANTAARARLGARDWEDMLQLAIPVFRGLLPPKHDLIVRRMLFSLATFHALAKLRMHTEKSLEFFDHMTSVLGITVRSFQNTTCAAYETIELPSEIHARGRRKAARDSRAGASDKTPKDRSHQKKRPKRVYLNLNTFKFHQLGHYSAWVRRRGPLDICSTWRGELEHRVIKRFARRSRQDKYRGERIVLKARRQAYIDRIKRKNEQLTSPFLPHCAYEESSRLPAWTPASRTAFQLSATAARKVPFSRFIQAHKNDVAFKYFYKHLKDYIYMRLFDPNGGCKPRSSVQRNRIIITPDVINIHKVLRVNYATYDMKWESDSINPRTQADVMLYSTEDPSGYLYARVISIFQVDVMDTLKAGPNAERTTIEVAWVRWFRSCHGRIEDMELPRLEFIPMDDPIDHSFGFVHPEEIICAAHILPEPTYGTTTNSIPSTSMIRRPDDKGVDFRFYSLGMFSRRDSFMRIVGSSVGHSFMSSQRRFPSYSHINEEEGPTILGADSIGATSTGVDSDQYETDSSLEHATRVDLVGRAFDSQSEEESDETDSSEYNEHRSKGKRGSHPRGFDVEDEEGLEASFETQAGLDSF